MSWTDERVATLKKLWGEGRTAAEIAKELGGVTRNAVIGKAHRLKLSSRVSPIQQNTKKSVKVASDVKKTVSKQQSAPKTAPRSRNKVNIDADKIYHGEGYSLAELTEKMCRWPIGDPKDENFKFCGCPRVPGIPYCAEHAKVAYQAATRNRVLKAEDFEPKKKQDEVELKDVVNG